MKIEKIQKLKERFDQHAQWWDDMHTVEIWKARELMELLGYQKWENFVIAIHRAMEACKNAGVEISSHFQASTETVVLGKGAEREIDDYILTRYACYLVAQNGDPRKEEIAFAQSYFAIQTRRTELIQERLGYVERAVARYRLRESEKQLSQNIYERDVDDEGFGRIRSKGDTALFGMSTAEMKNKLNMPPSRPLADFLPTLTIAAKNLATEMTNYNVEERDLYGEQSITDEHVQNNTSVRNMLLERNIVPENLPPAEDFQKAERKAKRLEKKLAESVPGLENNPAMLTVSAEEIPTKDSTRERIVSYLAEHVEATSSELAIQLGVSAATISRYTKALAEQGIIYATTQGKTRIWHQSERDSNTNI
ncbi:MAG: DNA damage-inducible protein D [Akkermansia sp.]|nr:DNA damage-inducible protein D [Akkermansia sp.]